MFVLFTLTHETPGRAKPIVRGAGVLVTAVHGPGGTGPHHSLALWSLLLGTLEAGIKVVCKIIHIVFFFLT